RRRLLPDRDRVDLALAGHLQPAAAAAARRRARAVHADRAAARPADLARRVRARLGGRHRTDPGAVRDRAAERPERHHRNQLQAVTGGLRFADDGEGDLPDLLRITLAPAPL